MQTTIREYGALCGTDALKLYEANGWTACTAQPEALRRGFAGTLLAPGAYRGEELIGLARAVGNGETVALLQDLLVHPHFQSRGVGTLLLAGLSRRFAHMRHTSFAMRIPPFSPFTAKTALFRRRKWVWAG